MVNLINKQLARRRPTKSHVGLGPKRQQRRPRPRRTSGNHRWNTHHLANEINWRNFVYPPGAWTPWSNPAATSLLSRVLCQHLSATGHIDLVKPNCRVEFVIDHYCGQKEQVRVGDGDGRANYWAVTLFKLESNIYDIGTSQGAEPSSCSYLRINEIFHNF